MKSIYTILFIVAFSSIVSFSQTIPQTLNYQGVLKDGSGVILPNGNYSITFKLYNSANGGSALWTETKSINLLDGVFATQLGSTTPITLPFTESYYLGVTVAAGSELTPRFPLSSVPYSFMSLNVPDGSITATKIANGEVVKSLNGLKDAVTLVAGSNVTITPNGNNLTISSAGGGGGIGGSGITNYIPIFSGTTTIGNSSIFQSGLNIGIGTTNPGAKLEIIGDAKIHSLTIGRGGSNIGTNSAFGNAALGNNTSGVANTCSGYQSMANNTAGDANTAFGYQTLLANNLGYNNTANGGFALNLNTTGYSNTAIGHRALVNATIGWQNTSVGANSLVGVLNGSYNTALGFNTGPSNSDAINTTCLGIDATATGNNMVRIGNTFVTSIGGQVGWSTLSDGRFKENINEDVPGLSFITQLRPVTYQINKNAFNNFIKVYEKGSDQEATENQPSQRLKSTAPSERVTGFIAQEVEQIANKLGYDFSGIDKPENSNDYYGLRYGEFVVPLVKAVQEQQTMIQKQAIEIENLKNELEALKSK
jgi:hypothetical protein